jgi:hypothetical protein
MSKSTTRLGNQDLVNIAKQRFDKQQRSKLPSIIVDLPSGGVIYPKSHPLASGKVEMRYMTAYDEDILTNASYIREGVIFDKLIESLVVDDINVNDIASSDKDALIINARISSYGHEYPVIVTDPKTNKQINTEIDLRRIQPRPFNLFADENGEFEYRVNTDYVLKFTYSFNLSDFEKVSEMLSTYITQVNDSRNQQDIDDFIRYNFLAGPAKKFRQYISENAPGLNYQYEFEGEDGGTFTSGFPIGTDLFWF